MIEIILAIGVATFIVYTAFSIASLMSMKRASDAVLELVKKNEYALSETLSGLKDTLEQIRNGCPADLPCYGRPGKRHGELVRISEEQPSPRCRGKDCRDQSRHLDRGVNPGEEHQREKEGQP